MFLVKLIPSRIFSKQARKPTGFIGRYLMGDLFTDSNAALNTFVKETLELCIDDHILEIGFGPGALIHEMADIASNGLVEGVDFSHTMLKQASKLNAQHIANGRVRLHSGECSRLPFADDSFDKVCAVNTLYFWPEPVVYLREILRVIKPGGKLVLGFRDKHQLGQLDLSADVFSVYSTAEVADIVTEAGFSAVQIDEKDDKPWASFCAVGNKA